MSSGERTSIKPGRVAFGVRIDLTSRPGGDTVQIERTADAMRTMGVRVDLLMPGELLRAHKREPYDVAHVWHLERVHDTIQHFEDATRAGLPVALSPIYWPVDGEPRLVRGGVLGRVRWCREDAKNLFRWFGASRGKASGLAGAERRAVERALLSGWASGRAALLTGADVVLPNSRAEGELLEREARFLGTERLPWRVVCNAIDVDACRRAAAATSESRSAIVSVGHFDPRKNQLHLIRELSVSEGPRYPKVTFIGEARRMHTRYYERCRHEAAAERFEFLGRLSGERVLEQLARARVHVCPSLLETPGLANLEAAACGCAVVAPDCAPVREYFQDEIEYFDPATPGSLRAAIGRAVTNGPPPGLAARVEREFSWTRAAEQTVEAYREIVGAGGVTSS